MKSFRRALGLQPRRSTDRPFNKEPPPTCARVSTDDTDDVRAPPPAAAAPALKVALAPPEAAMLGASAPCRFVVTPRKLGAGAYGCVLLGTDAAGAHVAVKIVADGRMKPAALQREVALLERLAEARHPALMAFYGHYPPAAAKCGAIRTGGAPLPLPHALGGCHCLVMEMARGGELFDRVVKAGGYDERRAAPLFGQLVDAVRAAHALGIVHRDLKLENVLYEGAEAEGGAAASRIKLIDWGLAHQHEMGPDGRPVPEALHSRCGSRSYMAPEVSDRAHSSTAGYDGFGADVWSLGVCLSAMVMGFFPFEQSEPEVDWRARRVRDAQREGASAVRTIYGFYPRKSLALSPALVRLIDSMLVFDPSRRATLDEVCASSWLAPHVPAAAAAAARGARGGGVPPPTHRRTSSADTAASAGSSSWSSQQTPTRVTTPAGFDGGAEALERQDSVSTAYSISSVGSSVVQSNARLRHMDRDAPSGRGEAWREPGVRRGPPSGYAPSRYAASRSPSSSGCAMASPREPSALDLGAAVSYTAATSPARAPPHHAPPPSLPLAEFMLAKLSRSGSRSGSKGSRSQGSGGGGGGGLERRRRAERGATSAGLSARASLHANAVQLSVAGRAAVAAAGAAERGRG